jgi:hypothetical protein
MSGFNFYHLFLLFIKIYNFNAGIGCKFCSLFPVSVLYRVKEIAPYVDTTSGRRYVLLPDFNQIRYKSSLKKGLSSKHKSR